MLYLTCTTITSVDLAHYGVSRAKDWVSVDCGSMCTYLLFLFNFCIDPLYKSWCVRSSVRLFVFQFRTLDLSTQ